MRLYYCDHFVLPLPPRHRFPMEKYRRLRDRVEGSGRFPPRALQVPDGATDQDLLRVHTPLYVQRVVTGELRPREIRELGFPWSPQLVERSRRSVGGTMAAARAALDEGVAGNLAGGTHHAFPHRPEGFCVFNDAAVAARAMQAEGRVKRVAILDLDVHQGNGTARIFRNDPSVFTVSVHGASNFPFRKEESDVDLPLPDGADDRTYLAAVEEALEAVQGGGRPDLVIYLAGADPYEGDRLGRLAVTRKALAQRDTRVFQSLGARGTPVAVVMAGGYAEEVDDVVEIHFNTLLAALERSPTNAS